MLSFFFVENLILRSHPPSIKIIIVWHIGLVIFLRGKHQECLPNYINTFAFDNLLPTFFVAGDAFHNFESLAMSRFFGWDFFTSLLFSCFEEIDPVSCSGTGWRKGLNIQSRARLLHRGLTSKRVRKLVTKTLGVDRTIQLNRIYWRTARILKVKEHEICQLQRKCVLGWKNYLIQWNEILFTVMQEMPSACVGQPLLIWWVLMKDW